MSILLSKLWLPVITVLIPLSICFLAFSKNYEDLEIEVGPVRIRIKKSP